MLFALWSENRATEQEGNSGDSRPGSIAPVSQHNSVAMEAPTIPLDNQKAASEIKDPIKLEIDEALAGYAFDDRRPAIFKSTGWEVCCVLALVSAQLSNVMQSARRADSRNWPM